MKYPEILEKRVVVTGCSSGIGEAAAFHLRDAGWEVLPTARKAEDLDRLRAEGFAAIPLDLADEASVREASELILEQTGGRLGGLVNNAGFGQAGAVEDLSRSMLRHQFEVNLIGMQDLTNRLLPAMRAQGRGRIVNISSVVGKVALPFFGAYSASKFAMEGLSDALRVELRPSGIAVSLIEPGPIATRFGDNASAQADRTLDFEGSRFGSTYRQEMKRREKGTSRGDDRFRLPPVAVAVKILHALESPRPRSRYPVTFPAHAGAWMKRLCPDALIDGLMMQRWKQISGQILEASGAEESKIAK